MAKSFSFAIEGIKDTFKKEPNIRIHFFVSALVILFALFFRFSPSEWLMLIITIFIVLILELINTAIESLVNLVSPDISPEAKVVKDISAASVLMGAALSIIVGAILFLPKISSVF